MHAIMWRTQRIFLVVNRKTSLFNKHTANLSLIWAGANHFVARYVSIHRIISTSCLSLPFAIQATQICIILTCLFIISGRKISLDRIKWHSAELVVEHFSTYMKLFDVIYLVRCPSSPDGDLRLRCLRLENACHPVI